MTERPPVTVGILTRNRLQKLHQCIVAIKPQLQSADQLLIFDTGSTDGTRNDPTVAEASQFCIIDEGVDFAAARMRLVEAACGDILFFTDDDCYAAPDLLERVVEKLQTTDAVGGTCLPARPLDFPWWWSADLGWTVGLSTGSFLRGDGDAYPATANLVASRAHFTSIPFERTPHLLSGNTPYAGGREDATWWRRIKFAGYQVTTVPKAIVFHDIPLERIGFRYVINRAQADGLAWWQREGDGSAAVRLRRALAFTYIECLKQVVARDTQRAFQAFVWLQRMLGAWHEARRSSTPEIRRELRLHRVLTEMKDETRRSVARKVYKAIGRSRACGVWPPENPQRIYVAADGFVGDTVLLRPLIALLAENFPAASILVSGRYHTLLKNLPANVQLRSSADDSFGQVDAAIIPYFVSGSRPLWKLLSPKAVTFSFDVGFPRDRYYRLARKLVHKDMAQHELHNLLNLFSLWPLIGDLKAPTLTADPEIVSQVRAKHAQLEDSPVITVQLGAGQLEKSWPIERFAELLNRLAGDYPSARFVLVGASDQSAEAEVIASRHPGRATNLCGCSLPKMLAALTLAQYHIGACSAPMQIASALGTPTYTLYGPTEPERWGALFHKSKHAFTRAMPHPLTWREYYSLPPGHLMRMIKVDEVHAGINSHLDRLGLLTK